MRGVISEVTLYVHVCAMNCLCYVCIPIPWTVRCVPAVNCLPYANPPSYSTLYTHINIYIVPFSQIKGLQLALQAVVAPNLPPLPVIPIVALISIIALTSAYHNQFKVIMRALSQLSLCIHSTYANRTTHKTKETNLAMERKIEGKGAVAGDTYSGLTPEMEENVHNSALFYSLFFVNAFFTCGWLLLSMTVLSQLSASLYYRMGMYCVLTLNRNFALATTIPAIGISLLTKSRKKS